MDDQHKAKLELFKTVATFGFLSAAMFCLGGPAILVFAPGLSKCFRYILIPLSALAGASIVFLVLRFYYTLARDWAKSDSPDPKADAEKRPSP